MIKAGDHWSLVLNESIGHPIAAHFENMRSDAKSELPGRLDRYQALKLRPVPFRRQRSTRFRLTPVHQNALELAVLKIRAMRIHSSQNSFAHLAFRRHDLLRARHHSFDAFRRDNDDSVGIGEEKVARA